MRLITNNNNKRYLKFFQTLNKNNIFSKTLKTRKCLSITFSKNQKNKLNQINIFNTKKPIPYYTSPPHSNICHIVWGDDDYQFMQAFKRILN